MGSVVLARSVVVFPNAGAEAADELNIGGATTLGAISALVLLNPELLFLPLAENRSAT
jgi:hypothetical protein